LDVPFEQFLSRVIILTREIDIANAEVLKREKLPAKWDQKRKKCTTLFHGFLTARVVEEIYNKTAAEYCPLTSSSSSLFAQHQVHNIIA